VQVREIGDLIDEERATGTTRVRPAVHARREHEMVEDQLPAAFEQIEQRCFAVRPFEHVGLVDLHHRHAPTLGRKRVVLPGERLFFGKQLLSGGLPLTLGDDTRKCH